MDPTQRVIDAIPETLPNGRRFIIAIAGPPAAGKSTLARALVERLDGRAGLLGMDGFHFDNGILDARGHRARKGAPHTFDVASYAMTLLSLREQPNTEMSVPVYDRGLSLSRNCASAVTTRHDIIVTEGNYLLLDSSPWRELSALFDLTVQIDTPLDVVEERIRARWRAAELSEEEIRRRTEENDLPNARTVIENSSPSQLVVGP
ncbi:MAG: pantothenate kinase [Verrucomicrobiales bacterium]|jgi:pantothenate kinase